MLYETFTENLRFSASLLERSGIRLLIEPINTRDIPGFPQRHTAGCRNLFATLARANVKIRYDVYHMQIMRGRLSLDN